jgi:outer membrane protein TolC
MMKHWKMTQYKPLTLCIALTVMLCTVPSQAQRVETLDLVSFLDATLQYHLTQQEHHTVARAEQLSLREGQRLYWPDITIRTDYDEIINETDATQVTLDTRALESGITTGVDTRWTSPVGTDVTLGLEHQYGRQLGKLAQGIPEEEIQAHNLSLEISQPLLKQNTPAFNNLPLARARAQWQQYQLEGELDQLTLLRNAMLDFTAIQEAHDRLRLEQKKLELARYLAEVTTALVAEGRSLSIDADLAQLDTVRQEQRVAEAELAVKQSQYRLTLSWVRSPNVQVEPLSSTSSLVDQLMPVLNGNSRSTDHPEYQQQQLVVEIAQHDVRAGRRDRWPDLSLYYRYEKNYRERLPDAENQAWGLRFSYALFDVSTREQQARTRAQATIARWNAEDRLHQLRWSITQQLQTVESQLDELNLHDQGLVLSQRALDQQIERYREGLASYTDVQNRQQDLLDRQLAALTTRVELARGLIELAYFHQWDWRSQLQ